MQQRFVVVPPVLRVMAPGLGPVQQPFAVFVLHTLLKHPYWRQPGGQHCRLARQIRDSLLELGDAPVWAIPELVHRALVECIGGIDLDAALAPFLLDHCEPILAAAAEPPKRPEPPEPKVPPEEPKPGEPKAPAPEPAAEPAQESSGG